MKCPRCQKEIPADQKYCGECGSALALSCQACGAASPPGQKFCGECGTALDRTTKAPRFAAPESFTPKHLASRILTSRSALEGERKQVTVLFADVKGSLELIEGSDPEHAHRLLDAGLRTMMDAVHRFEGTVNQFIGDGIMALFGAPIAHEDHAVRACYAALAMQDAARRAAARARAEFGVEPQVRVGLNSGEVVVRTIGNDLSMDYDAIGATTHLAGRMEQLAVPGTIRLTQNTLHLAEGFIKVDPLGPVPVKGLARPVEIYELVGATPTRSRFQAAVARGLTRFVGRDTEIGALARAFDRAAHGQGQVFALVGEAGVGKSRLFYEFTRSHRTKGALILETRSVSYGKSTAYFPMVELLKAYFDVENRDDARCIREKVTGKLLTLDEALKPVLPALFDLLDVPVEDPAWEALDPTRRRQRTLEAVRVLLLQESRVQPLVVVIEDLHWIDGESQAFLDSFIESLPAVRVLLLVNYRPEYHHTWGSKTYYNQHRIDPLPPDSATELLNALLGHEAELAPLKRMLVARTEGNPFFVEESVRTLVETGVLAGDPGAYRLTRDVVSIDVPDTVQGVLVARIDCLAREDKQLLQAASVIGKDVPYPILEAIADLPEDSLRRGLARLQENEFLYESCLFPDLEYTFKHAHTHEVTYAGLLAARRRALHGRIVDAIERHYAGRLVEHVERLAHHALRAEHWDRAMDFLHQSGAKAAGRSAYREAAQSFEQALGALGRLPETLDTLQQGIDLRFEIRSSLQALGEHDRVFELLREAEKLATTLGDQVRLGWASGYLSQYLWRMGDPAQANTVGQRARAIASALDDFALSVAVNFFLGQGHFNSGEYRRAIESCLPNIALLEGERAHQRLGLTGLPSVLSRIWLAWSLAERGEFAEALRHAEDALSIAEAADQPYSVAAGCLGVGQVELLRGALDQAIPALSRGVGLCRVWDLGVIQPTAAALLGLAYALDGQLAEAWPLLEADRGQDSSVRIFDTASARTALGAGYLLAGRLDEAEAATAAVAEFAAARGFRGTEGWVCQLRGNIGARRNPPDRAGAKAQYRRALDLAEERGMRPLAAHAHLGLGRLYLRSGKRPAGQEHLTTAAALYRDMDMQFWMAQAEAAGAKARDKTMPV